MMIKELHFEKPEYENRLAAVKGEMVKRGIDMLLLSEPPNQCYLTGYNAFSFYTPQMVIVALDHNEPIWVGRLMDRVSAAMTTYLSDENIRAYPDQYVQSTVLSTYDFIADIVKELGGEHASIGVEMGGYYFSARAYTDLVRALPAAKFVDADLLVNWIRIVKSPAELALMRQAGQIADAMMKRTVEAVRPGARQCDIAAAAYYQMMSGTPDFGGSYSCSPPNICIGERAIAPHAHWTDEPLPSSTILNLELSGVRHRYQVVLSRTVALGKPDPNYERLASVAVEAMNTALESVAPGKTCAEIQDVFRRTLAKHGFEKESRLGYSIGVGFPPAVGERTASLRKGDETVIRPGMTFHMMPGLWLDKVGVAITQSFAVTETGHEPLTSTPRALIMK